VARDTGDAPCGQCGEDRGDDLIGEDAVTAEGADRGIDQEQAERLAIPEVDEGQAEAMPEPIADQQIELLVDLDDRIAELPSPDGEGGEGEEEQARPARRRLFWSDGGNGTDLSGVEGALSGDGRCSSNVQFGPVRVGCGLEALAGRSAVVTGPWCGGPFSSWWREEAGPRHKAGVTGGGGGSPERVLPSMAGGAIAYGYGDEARSLSSLGSSPRTRSGVHRAAREWSNRAFLLAAGWTPEQVRGDGGGLEREGLTLTSLSDPS